MLDLVLLTHATEVDHPTNTGRLVQEVLGARAETIVWRREAPDAGLLRRIAAGGVQLLWPSTRSRVGSPVGSLQSDDPLIVIDATWQRARKIYNRSPYLHPLPTIALAGAPSRYALRRNQTADGLCTIEVAAHVLAARGQRSVADALESRFVERLRRGR
ncbi:MAG: tRNA-uridine aminocarboxypropyltransferase [Myxococcota bacterium]